jgi:hypothetical protein
MTEPRVVVAHREHLWWLLAEAAQLEHMWDHQRPHRPGRPLLRRAVITNAATGNTNIKALVCCRRLPPRRGRDHRPTGRNPGSCVAGDPTQVFDLRPYPGAQPGAVDAYVKQSVFPSCFANDLPARKAAVLAATQRPASTVILGQPSGPPAWADIP